MKYHQTIHESTKMYATTLMSCGHSCFCLKTYKQMDLCMKATILCINMMNNGELPPKSCVPCIKSWLCDECDWNELDCTKIK